MGPSPQRRNKTRARTQVIATNRYGLSFVQNRSPRTYASSGRRFASYYRHACTRCGWRFAGRRWQQHRLIDCDGIRACADLPLYRGLARETLRGAL